MTCARQLSASSASIAATLQKPVSSQTPWSAVDKVLSRQPSGEDLGREVRIAKAMQVLTAQYLAQLPQQVEEMISLAKTYKEDPEDVDLNQRPRFLHPRWNRFYALGG